MIKRTVIIGSILCLTACGTKDLAYFQANVDEAKLKADMTKVVEACTGVFGQNPNKQYVFIIHNLTRGSEDHIARAREHGDVVLIQEDIRDFDAIRPYFDDVDVVFHQAAIRITACAEQWRECQAVLVDGTYNVVEACVQAGVRRLVAASSASVYGLAEHFPTPEDHHLYGNRTWYGAAKIANEALYRAFHDMGCLGLARAMLTSC